MKKRNVMNQVSGIVLLVVGAVLTLWGYNESQSLGSQLNRLVAGNPTQTTLYYYIGGAICLLLGAYNLFRR